MFRFLLYSLFLHLLFLAVILGFSFFTTKPKTIQIRLASLSKANNFKKRAQPTTINKQAKEKNTQDVQKRLDKILKEDIKEKEIKKPVVKEVKKIESLSSFAPKSLEKTAPPILEKVQESPKTKILKPVVSPKDDNITPTDSPRDTVENNPKKTIEKDVFNPYTNPVLPVTVTQDPVKEDNPHDDPGILKEEIKKPSLPPRKKIDVSSIKEDNLNEVVSSINEATTDIMSSDNNYLSDSDKKALSDQISQCLTSIGMVRENTTEIDLMFELQENAKIKDIKVIKDNKIVPANSLNNLEARIIYLFNNPKCATLILPEGKFNYWKKFTIRINLRGLFE